MTRLLPNIFDPDEVLEIVDSARREVRYVVTDFSVELVVSKFRDKGEEEGDIYVPDYQRNLAWNEDKQSYFIESLILRVPIPPIFFYDVEGRLEIVDGSQRIRSLVLFVNDNFALKGLEKLDGLNGLSFSDFPPVVQRRLNNTPVRSFILDQGTDESTRIDLFRRINTSGKKLQDAEIRKGVFKGPFLDLVIKCANSPLFLRLTPRMGRQVDPESERMELVTRFFVYSYHYKEFKHDVRKFLDAMMAHFNASLTESDIDSMEGGFVRTMNFIESNYSRAFYRIDSGKIVPRVRFEAVAVGTALALRSSDKIVVTDISWLRSKEFEGLVRTDASNSAPKLQRRIEYVRDKLLNR